MDEFKDIVVGAMVMYAGHDREARPAVVTEIFGGGRLNLTVFGLRNFASTFISASHGAPEMVNGRWMGPAATWHRRVSSGVPGGGE